jgi:hypothetical protein
VRHGLPSGPTEPLLIRHIRGMRSTARALGGQIIGDMSVTVVVRSLPELSVRCGTRVARPARDAPQPETSGEGCTEGEIAWS